MNGEAENKVLVEERNLEADRVKVEAYINIKEACVKIQGIHGRGPSMKGKLTWQE